MRMASVTETNHLRVTLRREAIVVARAPRGHLRAGELERSQEQRFEERFAVPVERFEELVDLPRGVEEAPVELIHVCFRR